MLGNQRPVRAPYSPGMGASQQLGMARANVAGGGGVGNSLLQGVVRGPAQPPKPPRAVISQPRPQTQPQMQPMYQFGNQQPGQPTVTAPPVNPGQQPGAPPVPTNPAPPTPPPGQPATAPASQPQPAPPAPPEPPQPTPRFDRFGNPIDEQTYQRLLMLLGPAWFYGGVGR